MNYIAFYEDEKGKTIFDIIPECSSLEDATIEATNYAEENNLELLSIEQNG